VRVDGQISKKWLNKRKLVTSLGGGYFDSKDIHHDSSVAVGGIYYFDKPWTIQGAVRWNVSSPGNVVSRSQFIAVTEGREGEHYFVVRGQTGREAYQAITENIFLVDFPSHDVSVLWKQWLGNDWGFIALGEYYKSDFYQRTGGSIGIFKSF
jgi:YaiO family outer membrane protein